MKTTWIYLIYTSPVVSILEIESFELLRNDDCLTIEIILEPCQCEQYRLHGCKTCSQRNSLSHNTMSCFPDHILLTNGNCVLVLNTNIPGSFI